MTVSSLGGASLLPQLQQARFAKADANSDSQLSLSEFQAIGQEVPSGGKNVRPPPPQGWASSAQGFSGDTLASLLSLQQTSPADRAAAMVGEADANGDGAVTADELSSAMAAKAPKDLPADAPAASDMAAKMLADGDANGDGTLSLSEFSAMKPHGPPPAAGSGGDQTASAPSTDAADLNGDGVVSAAELLKSLSSAATHLGADVSSSAADPMQKLLAQLTSNLTGSDAGGSTVSIAA